VTDSLYHRFTPAIDVRSNEDEIVFVCDDGPRLDALEQSTDCDGG
jgi:hypothetical protein